MTRELRHDIITEIRRLIEFPYSKVCVHFAAGNLLTLLERHGEPADAELARAVVRADDETALRLLEEMESAR